jgi:hypothetical protein
MAVLGLAIPICVQAQGQTSGFYQVFGYTTPSTGIWRPIPEWGSGWEQRQFNDITTYRFIDPKTRAVFEDVNLERLRAKIRDARSVDAVAVNLGEQTAIQTRYVALDSGGDIVGLYMTANDSPTLEPGWQTPAAVIQDGMARGYPRLGQALIATLKAKLPGVKVRYDPGTDSFNPPVQ